jgi:bacterial leucyl aminopeptidase
MQIARSLLGLSLLTLGACAAPSRDDAWIRTDEAGAGVIEARATVKAHVELDGAGEGLVALQVPRSELAAISGAMHTDLRRCAGFMQRPLNAPPPLKASHAPYTLDNAATVTPLLAELELSNILGTIQQLSAFHDRYHESEDGKLAVLKIRDQWQGYAAARPDVKVELIEHQDTPQPSVSLTIPGKLQPEQRVILGGHLDSINHEMEGGKAPGADDNASGIAVLSEVIRVALAHGYEPSRTVVFYGYAAEEVGLVGSSEIAADAEQRNLQIEGVLQLDMTNYNPSPTPYMSLVTDYTNPTLNELGKKLIDEYVGIPWKTDECGYACSDHASWDEHGFAANHVFEALGDESNPELHTARDTLELTQGKADHSAYFARYAVAFMAEVAKGTLAAPDDGKGGSGGMGGASGSAAMAGSGGSAGAASAGGGSGGNASGGAPMAGGGGGSAGALGGGAGASAVAGASSTLTAGGDADASCACGTRVGDTRSYWLLLFVILSAVGARRRRRGVVLDVAVARDAR